MSRLTWLICSCARNASVNRSRSSGCDTVSDMPERSSGLKLVMTLFVSVCDVFHPTLYDVPNHGSRWFSPTFVVTMSVRVALGSSRLAGGCSWLLLSTLDAKLGRNRPAAAATRVSPICGSMRAAARSTLF
jgi:hypothetical protein